MNFPQAYLFAFFAGENYPDGEQIYFGISKDGLFWDDLNANQPVLYSNVGECGARDPFLIRGKDKFYLIATDLKIHGNYDWDRAVKRGSHKILRWESDDLLHWSDVTAVEIAVSDAGCTWAPEAIYDKERDAFLMYWASTSAADGYAKQRCYAAYTKDFLTFEAPFVYHEQESHIIDMTIFEKDGDYYRFYGSDRVMTVWGDVVKGNLMAAPADIRSNLQEVLPRAEGPICYSLQDGRVCLLADGLGIGYRPAVTEDLSDGRFVPLAKSEYRMPTRARHGGILGITTEEYRALREYYTDLKPRCNEQL